MAPAGRKRKPDPTIPRHIDQSKIPTGLYWDGRKGGCWYVFDRKPGERPKRKNVATRTATLADLHLIAEARAGKASSKVMRGLAEAFEDSDQFRKLSQNSRDDYSYCKAVVLDFKFPNGGRFGDLVTKRITRPVVQGLIDSLAAGTERDSAGSLIPTPSKAAHVQRYLRRLFRWGENRGYNDMNPADGVELPTERKRRRLPDKDILQDLIKFARANAGGRGQEGSVAPYLWAMIVIGYRCRLRPIEVRTLTDANALKEGIQTNRRKGSRDNITEWSPELREAWDYLVARRKAIWEDEKSTKKGRPANRRPVPFRAEDRHLVVNHVGEPLLKSTFNSAWRRLLDSAVKAEVMSDDHRFGAHDLKRRGITDTPGTRGEKQQASGHKNEAMLDVYDYSVPLVKPAGDGT
ncbi:site-specific integrase [Stenotrophomonas pigmentata]|uniref:site-specific integrase n=1 Tax=Stenotrophomonas pigmentata TaxID=3055080 RepID=UPI0026F0FE0C|nr:integrase [Stenotrophomonas sp. 610A2]